MCDASGWFRHLIACEIIMLTKQAIDDIVITLVCKYTPLLRISRCDLPICEYSRIQRQLRAFSRPVEARFIHYDAEPACPRCLFGPAVWASRAADRAHAVTSDPALPCSQSGRRE